MIVRDCAAKLLMHEETNASTNHEQEERVLDLIVHLLVEMCFLVGKVLEESV